MTIPNVVGLAGRTIHELFVAVVGSLISDAFSPTAPPTISVQPPLPRSRMYDISNISISLFLLHTVRRPQGFLNVVNESTSVLAYGIRRILHFQRGSNTAPPLVDIETGVSYPLDIESGVTHVSQPSQISRLMEAIREFVEDEPLTSDMVRQSIIVGLSFVSLAYGARYVTTLQNRRRLQRAIPDTFGSQPGSAPLTGLSLSRDREGRIIVIVTPLALFMGCNVVIIAMFWTIYRSRRSGNDSRSGNGSQGNLDGKSESRQ